VPLASRHPRGALVRCLIGSKISTVLPAAHPCDRPAFIAACEAVEIPLRHRALIWFAKAGKRGIGNIAAAKELVMEVWRRVDRMVDDEGNDGALGPVDWRRVMEDMEWKIMLT
jgi:hypothetical protein